MLPGACQRSGLTITVGVRGDNTVTSGPSASLQTGRPETEARAELQIPADAVPGLAWGLVGGILTLDVVDVDELPPGLRERLEPPPEEGEEEGEEDDWDLDDALEDAMDDIRTWAFPQLIDASRIRLVPTS